MSHFRTRFFFAGAFGLGVLGSAALAQVVTPPTAAPPATPAYVPPPPPPPPPPRPVAQPAGKPGTDQATQKAINEMQFKSLVERDAGGKLIQLKVPAHRAALANNPFIDAETHKKIDAVLAERDAQLERLAIENLDVVLKVDDGGFAKIDAPDTRAEIKALRALGEPLKPPGGELAAMLTKAGIINDLQAKANQKIVQDYTKVLFSETRGDAPPKPTAKPGEKPDAPRGPGMSSTRLVYVMQVEETMAVYHKLLGEAGGKIDDVIDAAHKADAAGVKSASGDEGKLKAMQALMQKLGPETGRELLKKTIEKRGK